MTRWAAPLLAALFCVPSHVLAWNEEPLCAVRLPLQDELLEPLQDATCTTATGDDDGDMPESVGWTKPLTASAAREAYQRSQTFIAEGRLFDALLELRVVEHALPRIADRIALQRGELLRAMAQPATACKAFPIAIASPERNVAVRARVGHVRCLLESDDAEAEAALGALNRRYSKLAERQALRLELAHWRRRRGTVNGAASLYRTIDLTAPTSPAAEIARQALEQLASEGVRVRKLTPPELVDRSERVVRSGSPAQGREVVDMLMGAPGVTGPLRARALLLQARVARIEGRWKDARRALSGARQLGADPEALRKLATPAAPIRDGDDGDSQQAWARGRIAVIVAKREMNELRNPQLRRVLELATQYGLAEAAEAAVVAMAERATLGPVARFEAGVLAAGLVRPDAIADLLRPTIRVKRYRVSGRYHYARALEQSGALGEAEAQYLAVIAHDRSSTRYYSMWADQRLWALQNDQLQACTPAPPARPEQATASCDPMDEEGAECEPAPQAATCAASALFAQPTPPPLGKNSWETPELPANADTPERLRVAALERLVPLAEQHGEAFPWLLRAVDLVHLERFADAADELNEAYLAYRDARGSPRLRSGLHAMYTGEAPARRAMAFATKQARKKLDRATRKKLSVVTSWLGDPGTSLRFQGWRPEQRPRAYAEHVHRAAEEYGIDPNLLFAVMRVESIYNRRIISYAGAIGLMQIMPRTGRLIAQRVGAEDFRVTDLLDPQTNVRFSAWYLSSLLERFGGRLPLAIASYNGGPHNVRLWMRSNNRQMPLDAFLERIPFSQTHRYVRRVLTHYAAYRAQRDMPMPHLDVELPIEKPDVVAF